MPFTVNQLAEAAKVGLDFYVKNNPIDQIAVDRPLMKALLERAKEFPGAKEYVVEQLRKSYDSNFQWYRSDGTVTYNTRNTIEQVKFAWRSAHDGYVIDEDRLAQNGIIITDDRKASADNAEMVQLTNLLDEHNEALMLGFKEKFSAALHLDGTASADAIQGLDALVTLAAAPTATGQQVVGALDRFTSPWWRNQRATAIATNVLLDTLEAQYRTLSQFGAGAPTHIFAGGTAIDAFRNAAIATGQIQRYTTMGSSGTKLDPSVTGLSFHGTDLQFCPEFDNAFGGTVSPTIPWAKRLYMLNLKQLKLRPLKGQNMVSRKPPRPADKYVVYSALTWKGALTLNMSACQGAYSVA